MSSILRSPAFLPSCILAGIGLIMLVLVFTLPPLQVVGILGTSAVAVGLVLARLRREAMAQASDNESWMGSRVQG